METGVTIEGGASAEGRVCVCKGMDALRAAGLAGTAELAIWKRPAGAAIRTALDSLDFSAFEDVRIEGSADAILNGLEACLRALPWPGLVKDYVAGDVIAMMGPMRTMAADFTLRLEYVTHDACRKFHRDDTDFRLITTYLGRGTQWMEDTGAGPGQVHELDTLHVAMLLGQRCAFPGRILHRSPPIEGTGEARLVMVLDVERPGYC